MKFSEQWLREWVNPSITTEQLAHQLTMAGLEVDAVEAVAGVFDNVVVAKVLSVTPHPDANKLNVCSVDAGQAEPLQIVCGASNVAAGMMVPAALVGASLPGGLKIKRAKLRGVESFGMLCSAAELGLAESAEGLLPLPTHLTPGVDVREALNLNDKTLELGLTPNRGDCLGVIGVAREVGVLNNMEINIPAIPTIAATISDTVPVELAMPLDCPHYAGRVIRNINAKAQTPLWMQERLRRSGVRCISATVDVTNYVLLELGQPMHAFDLEKLQGGIQVRHAGSGEKLVLLDGQEIQLNEGSLVIADDAQALALAGIMGGEASAVTDETRHIFLESAFFNPTAIAGRARSYGLHTDSSHRFERGVDPYMQTRAIERATALLLDIVGGEVGPVIDVREEAHMPARQAIALRKSRIEKLLGVRLGEEEISNILTRLGMEQEKTAEGWQVTAPAFRFDMNLEVDLIEELARIHGYDNIPVVPLHGPLNIVTDSEATVRINELKSLLVARGYQEAITYTFVDAELQQLLDPRQELIHLANPISADMSVMRTNLWPGLVSVVKYNLSRQQSRLRLFEYGLRFRKVNGELQQQPLLAGAVTGPQDVENWTADGRKVDFYDVKGDVENLLSRISPNEQFTFKPEGNEVLHPGQSARIYRGEKAIGWIGALHPNLQQKLDISANLFLYELDYSVIMEGSVPKFSEMSKFPSIRRDIAIVVDEKTTYDEVISTVQKIGINALKKLQCFDVYMGKGIDSGRKSLALGLTFQDLTRTLNDDAVDAEINKILTTLHDNLGATLRS